MIIPNDVKLTIVAHHILLFLSSESVSELMQSNSIFSLHNFLILKVLGRSDCSLSAKLYALNKD